MSTFSVLWYVLVLYNSTRLEKHQLNDVTVTVILFKIIRDQEIKHWNQYNIDSVKKSIHY